MSKGESRYEVLNHYHLLKRAILASSTHIDPGGTLVLPGIDLGRVAELWRTADASCDEDDRNHCFSIHCRSFVSEEEDVGGRDRREREREKCCYGWE